MSAYLNNLYEEADRREMFTQVCILFKENMSLRKILKKYLSDEEVTEYLKSVKDNS